MSSRRPVRQLVVAILFGVLVGGGLMAVTPAGAEVSQAVATNWKKIWKKNLKPLADRRYYTKAQSDTKYQPKGSYETAGSGYTKAESDAKYAGAGSSYTKAEGDARYLPKRTLLTGTWASGAIPSGSQPLVAINYGAVLSVAPTATVYRAPGSAATPQCPGTAAAPDAAPGVLCVYGTQNLNFNGHYFIDPRVDGVVMAAFSTSNSSYMYGTWAVRATGFAGPSAAAGPSRQTTLTGESAGR